MRIAIGMAGLLCAIALGSCMLGGVVGSLPPTLTMADDAGLAVAMQNGMPVPTFSWQPRPRLDLDGEWRVERLDLDAGLTLTDRATTLPAIEEEGAGRHGPDYDHDAWERIDVPGTVNPPPDAEETGSWYRHRFGVPRSWAGDAVTLRFGSANYVTDVWLNGVWLGYHEGGSTPFAFDASAALEPGEENVIAVRVDTPPIGSRSDVVPWALVDWWNYGGITGSVWLEAAPPTHVVRADVVPHLDAVEVDVLVRSAPTLAGAGEPEPDAAGGLLDATDPLNLRVSILPATVTDVNLLDPDPRRLVSDQATPLAVVEQEIVPPSSGGVTGTTVSVLFGEADTWTPARPALYVLHVELIARGEPLDAREATPPDALWSTFGIRHVTVDPVRPRVLLNGEPVFFRGVGLHAETLVFSADGDLVDGTPAQTPEHVLAELQDARAVGADLLRTGHLPGDPIMLMLADRLGFAVWEEIPLYHATPVIFERTMARGIPQQMLREMALRDMNHPSVLFHGFANESTGTDERAAALSELHEIDRAIDGTRLTGQAAYGWQPDDPTHAPLDVAGFTFYYGVFYGEDPELDTRRALREAHEANPDKPILALEFGRWADFEADEEQQRIILGATYAAFERYRADEPDGFVSAATWWTLHDFVTQIAGIGVEDFGLYRPDGTLRPAGERAMAAFDAPAGRGSDLALEPDLQRTRALPPRVIGDWTLAGYLAYGFTLSVGVMGIGLLVLIRRGGRATGRFR